MTTPRFVLMRHGETDWNTKNQYQGSSDIPLNAVGRAQAGAAAGWIAHLNPVAIWASPLERALDTARAVASFTGQQVNVDPRLAELDYGDFEGWTWEQIEKVEPGLAAWRDGESDGRWSASGETGAEVMARMGETLTHLGPCHRTRPDPGLQPWHGHPSGRGGAGRLGLPGDLETRLDGQLLLHRGHP
nr:histidine phosphatase family protein [Propionibacterium freudenreichii]